MRHILTTLLAAAGLLCPGCTALFDFGEFSRGQVDAGQGVDAGDAGDAHDAGSPPDGGADGVELAVTVAGEGTVSSAPAGIDCGATCTAAFPDSAAVTLTATGDGANGLRAWSEDCTGFAPTCALTMDAPREVGAAFAPRGSTRWVAQVGLSEADFTQSDVVIAPDGDPIVAGIVRDDGARDLYVAKLDADDGAILWERRLETMATDYYGGLAVDGAGNVYAAVAIRGFEPFTIGTTMVAPDPYGNVLVVRLAAATGALEWVRDWGGSGQDRPKGVAVSGTDLFVVGETSGGDFDGITISTADAFIARASTETGAAVDVTALVGNVDLHGVAARGGRVGVTGGFMGAASFGAGCSIDWTGASADGFVADFDASTLECQWANDFGSSTAEMNASPFGIAAHPEGGYIATGLFKDNVLFAESGTLLTSRGGNDVFVVRYAGDGAHVWSFRYGDTGSDLGIAVAVGDDGSVLVAGQFESEITFGAFTLDGASDVFVTRLGPGLTPTHEWAVAFGADNRDRPDGIAVDSDGNPYVVGYFSAMTVIDDQSLTAAGSTDGFVAGLIR